MVLAHSTACALSVMPGNRRRSSTVAANSAIGLSRTAAYARRADDAGFRQAWDQSVEAATEIVESTLFKQAKDGNTLACIFWANARDQLRLLTYSATQPTTEH
jgi:hypothetical protein